ncbi:MAG: MATE family efflux transporter [Chitinispirillales bacterium]|jgi:putative MATE family efflux protein|nr:MATE family efflux transporter [Chitinispirillales bacterium]
MDKFGKDLTEGSIPRHLLSLAVPMLLANLLSAGYGLVNAFWVGRFIGREAMGAIAVSFPVIFIYVGVAAGATVATTILVSQFYGARNYLMVTKTVSTSSVLAIILAVLSSVCGILFVDRILTVLGTPETIFPLASSYLRITFLGIPLMFLSLLVTSILRGAGDTRTPLYFMAAGLFLNTVLDPIMIMGIGPFPAMGLNGAAWATIISSFVSLSLGVIYLRRKGGVIAAGINRLKLDAGIAKLIFKIGFPSMIQQSALALGIAAVTSLVNSFGAAAAAGFGVAGRIDSLAFLPAQSMGLAVSAITGQNLGAGRYDRVQSIFKWAMLMTLAITLFFSIFFVTIPGMLLFPFTTDLDVIAIGETYLRIVGPATVFFAVMYVSNGIMNGAGHTMTTLIFTLVAVWGIRVPLAILLSRTSLGLTGIWVSYAIAFLVMMCISLLWYKSGRWKKVVIKHGDPLAQEAAVGVDVGAGESFL